MDKHAIICEKLRKLGYTSERRIKLYGEELRLTSNPISDGFGFSVEAIAIKSGKVKRIRLPLPVVDVVEKEVETFEMAA